MLYISDMLGKKLKTFNVESLRTPFVLDVSTFEKGIYFVTLSTVEKSITRKIILN